MIKKIFLAFQFLTVIPVKTKTSPSVDDIAKSSSVFVLVGFIQGVLLVITDYISGMLFHPELVTGIILLVYVISSGGFHLDGLADTADAVAVKSSGNNEEDIRKRLSVMRDGATGPVGVMAIVFMILLKYLSLKNISHLLPFTYYSSLVAMPAVSKWAMVVSIYYGKPAREDGLGRIFIGRIGNKEIVFSSIILILFLSLPLIFFEQYSADTQYIFYGALLVLIYLFCRLSVYFCLGRFNGLTGDTLGAIGEISELSFLLIVIAWSRLFIS